MSVTTTRQRPMRLEIQETEPRGDWKLELDPFEMTRFAKWVWRTRRSVAFGPGGSTFMDLPDTGKFSLRYWPRWMQSRGRDWHPLIGCGLEASVNPENVDLPGKLYVRRIIQASSGGVKSAALTPTPGRGEAEGQAGEQED